MSLKNISQSNIMVCGIVRDCEDTLLSEISKITNALNNFKNIHYYIVESDSNDQTLNILNICKKKFQNFNYLTLGNIENNITKRTERLAFCRNKYLEYLNNFLNIKIDFVLIADLDGVNKLLNIQAIESCWETNKNWDVITANQTYKYYDIYALRHTFLNPFNHMLAINQMTDNFEEKDLIKFFIENKYFKISLNSQLINVDSAFGGLAIYKKETLKTARYCGLIDNFETCEHVSLNLQIKKNNYNIYINPKLINTDFTIHTPKINFFRQIVGFNLKKKIKKFIKL